MNGKEQAQAGPALVSESSLKTTTRIFLLALAYFITGWLGLKLPAIGSHITLLWLPTGIATAALLRWGCECWPGVALAALAANLSTGLPWQVAAGIAVGNTLGPLLAARALRCMRIHAAFDRKRDILLLATGGVLGMLVSASLGVTTLSLAGQLPDGRVAAWLTWWAGDTMGVITAAPLVLAFTRKEWRSILRRCGEFLICMVATGLAVWGVFVLNRGLSGGPWALAFVPLPMLAWAALRFGSTGTSLALIVLSAGAAYGTATGRGPFHRPDPIESVLVLWIYMATSAVLGWLIMAVHFTSLRATGIQILFEEALSDVSLGILLSGLDRRITYANQGFTRLTGYAEADLLGKSCSLLHGPETDPATVEKLRAALRGDGHFEGEILNYRRDGTPFWNALLISPVHDEQGAMTGFLGIQRDITPRKETEMALLDSRSRLDSILNSMEDVVWSTTPDGQTLNFVSASAQAMYGHPPSEFKADPMKWLAMIHPDDRDAVERAFHKVAESGGFDAEYRIIRADGAVRWVHDRGRIVKDERGQPLRLDGIVTGITERRRLEQEREQYLKFFRLSTEPMCIADPFGCFMQVNPAFIRLTGFSESELLTRPFLDFVLPEDRGRTAEEMKLQVAVRPSMQFENRYGCKDGTILLLSWTAIFDKNDGVTYATARDITKLRQGEIALRDSEEHFRRLIEHAPEAIQILDVTTGRFVQLNSASERLFKRPAAELCRMGPMELSPPLQPDGRPSSERAKDYIARAMAGEQPVFEWTHCDAEGRAVPCEVRLLGMEIGGRAVVRGSVTDISERKAAEARMKESEARYRTLFEANPHPMWAYDLETLRFLAVNASAVTHYGYSREEFLAMTIKDIRPPEDIPALLANVAAVDDGLDQAGVWRHRRRDGSIIEVEITSHVMEFDGRSAEVVLAYDVTEQRRAKLEREQLDRKMRETQKLESLGVLAGGIAHDFNNILTAILGNASLAINDVSPASPVHECLGQISQAAIRAADLCKQMLAYSGRGRFVVRRLDLGQLIAETIQMLHISISKKAVLQFQPATALPPVEADPTQIRQVIMNLVINASDAIGEKGGVITVTTGLAQVDAACRRTAKLPAELPEGDYVFIEVSDNGCGMSAETQAKIFDPFFTTKFTGRGLGLAAVLGIVRGHKGAMKVYSEPGRGSTFKLLFPVASGPAEAAPESHAASTVWRGHGTVLVVDDEQAVRTTVAPMLAAMGLESVLANDGQEGVERFRADPGHFSLVLLDLTMPRMDGAEAFAKLRQLRAGVPVVLMSGFNEQEALVRFAGKGIASFIQKPFTFDSLRTVIRSVLG